MTQVKGIKRLEETLGHIGGHGSGDNWHMSWAGNDKQYVALCDGIGWPEVPEYTGEMYNTRVYAISGDLPDVRFKHLSGYPDLITIDTLHHPNQNRYYGFGILALDNYIYNYLSTPNRMFLPAPGARFVGAKLIYSPDNGETWKNQDGSPLSWEKWEDRSRDNMVFFNEPDGAFSLLTVLQMGKNYEQNTDGYVYVYAPNGNEDGTMNQLVMFRVPKNKILDRSCYEYFVSINADGTAGWSSDIHARKPVYTFPAGWVNVKEHPYSWHPSVAYNKPLGVYMMSNWGMGPTDDGWWFGKPSYLGFWVAATPWGPWTQVHEETSWTTRDNTRTYQPQICPKWIAEDGKSFWLVFTDFQEIDGKYPYYCFNYEKVEILTD